MSKNNNKFYFWVLQFQCLVFFIFLIAIPIVENNVFVLDIEYSPLVGGFAIVLSDGRAAFLTASSLKFDPNVGII